MSHQISVPARQQEESRALIAFHFAAKYRDTASSDKPSASSSSGTRRPQRSFSQPIADWREFNTNMTRLTCGRIESELRKRQNNAAALESGDYFYPSISASRLPARERKRGPAKCFEQKGFGLGDRFSGGGTRQKANLGPTPTTYVVDLPRLQLVYSKHSIQAGYSIPKSSPLPSKSGALPGPGHYDQMLRRNTRGTTFALTSRPLVDTTSRFGSTLT
eukprot:GEMP01077121.1.p1 GENE.GEMP01077121.1~~GEMP01077121.1.p1  ORF type:complete len:218 (+),score=31.80 GEMP01077121.1:164-817(+)